MWHRVKDELDIDSIEPTDFDKYLLTTAADVTVQKSKEAHEKQMSIFKSRICKEEAEEAELAKQQEQRQLQQPKW